MDPSFYQVLRLTIGRFSRTWLESASSLVWKDGHPYDQLLSLIKKMEKTSNATEHANEFKTLITSIIRSWNAGKLSKPAEIDTELFKTAVKNIMDAIDTTAEIGAEELGPVYYTGNDGVLLRIKFPDNEPIVAVCDNSRHFSLFISKSRKLYYIGTNPLDNMDYQWTFTPKHVPMPELIRQVSSSLDERFFAVTVSGTLYAWGVNIYGASIFRKFGKKMFKQTQIAMPDTDPYVVHVECSDGFAAILSTTGKVYILGDYWELEQQYNKKMDLMRVFKSEPMTWINARFFGTGGFLSGCSASGSCYVLLPDSSEFEIRPKSGKYVQCIARYDQYMNPDEILLFALTMMPEGSWHITLTHMNFKTGTDDQKKMYVFNNPIDHISTSIYSTALFIVITKTGEAHVIRKTGNNYFMKQIDFADKIGDYTIGSKGEYILARVPQPVPFNINCKLIGGNVRKQALIAGFAMYNRQCKAIE